LKEAVLGRDYALGEEQVVLVLCVNMGNSPAIAQNVDGSLESLYPQLTGDDGESLMGGGEISFLAKTQSGNKRIRRRTVFMGDLL